MNSPLVAGSGLLSTGSVVVEHPRLRRTAESMAACLAYANSVYSWFQSTGVNLLVVELPLLTRVPPQDQLILSPPTASGCAGWHWRVHSGGSRLSCEDPQSVSSLDLRSMWDHS